MTRIAIIHTTPATVEPLKALASELLPGCEVVNFVDDSILPQLGRSGGDLDEVEPRMLQYAKFAEQAGADVILEACSSCGPLVGKMQDEVRVPVVRIDEAMAEAAVQRGTRIGVAATLATTLTPTTALIREKARALDRAVEIEPLLVDAAYQKLMAGDRDAHDALLVEALSSLARRVDVVVLAQASMARVLPTLPLELQDKFLTSPRTGMERVKAALKQ